MNLTFRYDSEADILAIITERQSDDTTPLEGPELGFIAIDSAGEDSRDVVGVEIIFAASYVVPYFRLRQENTPPRVGNPEHTSYDPVTDTLTWGAATDAPDMVSQVGDLIVYWRPDPKYDGFFAAIGLSLRNAAKHLSPYFERVELPAG